MNTKISVTPSLEDYLEKILFIKEKNSFVRVTDVAFEMNISKPSVNKAVKILKEQGLIIHEKYGLLILTDKGVEIAKCVAKRHTVLKRFLKDLLKIEEVTAENEACLIEHAISLETINKLSDYLNTVL